MDRCVVIGGCADGEVVDVKPENQYMEFCKEPKFDLNNYNIATMGNAVPIPERHVYRKEFLRVKNSNGTWADLPFLVEKNMSTADALRKVFFSYRLRK